MNTKEIIILHGWGLSGRRFEPLTKAFEKKGYSVFTPDLPGFGENKLPDKPLFLSDYTDFLKKFIRINHIRKPILFGHSFGARVAIRYASEYTSDISALILSGAPGYPSIHPGKKQLFVGIAKIGKKVTDVPLLVHWKESIRRYYYYLVGARDFYRAEGVMRETFKHIVEEQLEGAMEKIQCPTLLLWGENDTIVPVTVAYRMQKTIKHARLVKIPDATHSLPIIHPDICVLESMTFIQSL